MTIATCISRVDAIKPNTYTNDEKVAWLNEIEGDIQLNIFLIADDSLRRYTDYATDKDKELLVRSPYDRIYEQYLYMKIDYANAEYSEYANDVSLFNSTWDSFSKWISLRIRPSDRKAMWRGYYLIGEKGDTGGEGPLYRHQMVMYSIYDGYSYLVYLDLYSTRETAYEQTDLSDIVTTYGVDRGEAIQIGVNGSRASVTPPTTPQPVIAISYNKSAETLDAWTENISEFTDDVASIY